jgi:divalent metal cation (Fe/Co/Zn/Cd) transporter
VARRSPNLHWLAQTDAVAAMIVAIIVVYVSIALGRRTIQALLDAAPQGLTEKVESTAAAVPGVVDAHAVRVRPSGALWFIDLHVTMDGRRSLKDAHAATERIERAIFEIVPNADVTVHVEPREAGEARPLKGRGRKA